MPCRARYHQRWPRSSWWLAVAALTVGGCGAGAGAPASGRHTPADDGIPSGARALNDRLVHAGLARAARASNGPARPPTIQMHRVAPFAWTRLYVLVGDRRDIQAAIRRGSGFTWRAAPERAAPVTSVASLLVFVNRRHVVSAVHDRVGTRPILFGCLGATSRARERSAIVVYRTRDRSARTNHVLKPALFATWRQAPTRRGCVLAQRRILY